MREASTGIEMFKVDLSSNDPRFTAAVEFIDFPKPPTATQWTWAQTPRDAVLMAVARVYKDAVAVVWKGRKDQRTLEYEVLVADHVPLLATVIEPI